MFPTSAIIFIKYRNGYDMKNNIRCKDNINNTSVIIFNGVISSYLMAKFTS